MPDYRLFRGRQADGDVEVLEEFFATSDETALNFAITRAGLQDAELWCWPDRRLIALITRDVAR